MAWKMPINLMKEQIHMKILHLEERKEILLLNFKTCKYQKQIKSNVTRIAKTKLLRLTVPKLPERTDFRAHWLAITTMPIGFAPRAN